MASRIIDITDPASPVAVAAIADGTSYPNLAGGYAITTVQRGNLYYALVASQSNNGVQIINITDPASPTPVAAFNDGATYTELLGAYSITTTQIGDSHYALVTGFSDHGVQIINITDIANPAPAAAPADEPSIFCSSLTDIGNHRPDRRLALRAGSLQACKRRPDNQHYMILSARRL